MTRREVLEGTLTQGSGERVAYELTTTPWGTTPSAVSVTLWDITGDADMSAPLTWEDVSATRLSGSANAVGDVITTPLIIGLVPNRLYRCDVQFTCSGNTFKAYAVIQGQA